MLVRRLALAAAGLTLVLIVAGGLVTNTDSGLAGPDWPTCFGSPMPKMVGSVAVEHAHRLIASSVGLLSVVLCVLLLPTVLAKVSAVVLPALVLGGAFTAAHGVHKTGAMPALPAAICLLGFGYWYLHRPITYQAGVLVASEPSQTGRSGLTCDKSP